MKELGYPSRNKKKKRWLTKKEEKEFLEACYK